MLNVIERQDGVEHHETGFVFQRLVGLPVLLQRHRLEPCRRVVPQVADRAAGEAWQLGNERRTVVGHHLPQHVDERLGIFTRHAGPLDDRLAVARPKRDERVLAEERIPGDLLSSFHALEQKRVVRVLCDLQECGHRREQIGDDLLHDRDERSPPRQIDELFEGRLLHASCPLPVAAT